MKSDTALLVIIFAFGILGGLALYGRRCERRLAAVRRADELAALEQAEAEEEAELLPEEEPADATGGAEA